MKVIIYCFSGTGNTLFAARETVKALTGLGYETDIYRIVSEDSPLYAAAWVRSITFGKFEVCSAAKKEGAFMTDSVYGSVPDPNNYDIAGFAYPIYSHNAPQFFVNFIKVLPKLKGRKIGMHAFLFKTSGGPSALNNASSWLPVRELKKKGFWPCIDMHMLMPYNRVYRYPDAMAKQMVLHTKEMSLQLAKMVKAEDFLPCNFRTLPLIFAFPGRLQSLLAKFNGNLHSVNPTFCTSCEKCVYNCPTGNIYMVGRSGERERVPQIGWDCTMCMQCTAVCPQKAITPGFAKSRKCNPGWDYAKLLANDSIPANWTDRIDAGHFRSFRKYYQKHQIRLTRSKDKKT